MVVGIGRKHSGRNSKLVMMKEKLVVLPLQPII